MEYIAHTQFCKKAICGEVDIPVGTHLQMVGGIIYLRAKPICLARSEAAFKHFTRNDDGNGLKRWEIITKIKTSLNDNPELWEKLEADDRIQKFDKNANGDTWLWNEAFYNAEIADLEYVIGVFNN